MSGILRFLPLFARLKRPMLLTLLLSLITLGAGIGLLGVSGWFLTAAALSTAGAAFNLFAPSAGVRGLSFVRILSRYGEKLQGHEATLRLLSDLRRWLFATLFPLAPLGRRFGRGDIVSRLLGDIEALDTMFLVALGPISTALIVGLCMTAWLAVVLPGAALIYAATYLAAVLPVPTILIAASRPHAAEAAEAGGRLRGAILDGIDGHQDLVLFNATGRAVAQMSEAAAHLGRHRALLGRNGALASAIVQALMALALLGTLAAGIASLRAAAIDGPLLVGILLAVIASFEASAVLVRSASRLASSAAAAGRLHDIESTAPALAEAPKPVPLPADPSIGLERVRFGYNPHSPVLVDLDLLVQPGEVVAITGPSGNGKSTIAQLLLRLCDPQGGRVLLGGVDLRDVSTDQLRRRVALMAQDAPVFLDTIRNNLAIGRPEATEAQMWSMLEAVRLAGFVRTLPGGLDAFAGEAGRTFSAGQSRRLCLARTLLSGAEIIVLDEPTSGLDQPTEAALLAELPDLLGGRTCIVITHAAMAGMADRVVALRGGRLTEQAMSSGDALGR